MFSSVSFVCFLCTHLFISGKLFFHTCPDQAVFFFLEDNNFVESIISNKDLPSAKEILEAVVWRTCLNLSL